MKQPRDTTHDSEITAVVLHALQDSGRTGCPHDGVAFGCIPLRYNALSVRTMVLPVGVAWIARRPSSGVRQTKVNGGYCGAANQPSSH